MTGSRVLVVGPEKVTELWLDGTRFGHTPLRDGRAVLGIEPRQDARPWEVGAHDLREALARAAAPLEGE